MPRWVRWLQPLLSGVFTVDNLDYVRRDAYLTGVAVGPVDVERLRRYSFITERGLTLFEPGLPALEMFLTLAPVHVPAGLLPPDGARHRPRPRGGLRPVDPGDLRRGLAGRPAGAPTPTSTSTASSTRRPAGRAARASPSARCPATARSARPSPRAGRRSSCAGRRGGPRSSSGPSTRRAGDPRPGSRRSGRPEPGRVAIDLAEVDARPADATAADALLAIETRDGSPTSLSSALASIPAYWLIARRYRRRT